MIKDALRSWETTYHFKYELRSINRSLNKRNYSQKFVQSDLIGYLTLGGSISNY